MATDADIPALVCEATGDQVGTIVDNIIKISLGQISLEKQIQDDKHNELPIVEGGNFLKPPSIVGVHCEATPDISKVIEEPDQTAKEDMDTLLLSTKDTSSDLNGTSDSYTGKSELAKEMLQETSLQGEETESPTPCISESEELNVQLKTLDNKSADEKPTEEDMSSKITNKVASEQDGLKIEESVEENLNASAEKVSHESIVTPGETVTKEEDGELKEAELSENEQSTKCTLVKEDKHIENHAESLHAAPENIDVSDLSQENSIEGPPEEQRRDVTLHGDTIEAKEATVDADDEHKESLESLSPIVSSSHKEGSVNAVLEEDTGDYTDGKIVAEVDKFQEALESPSTGEAHREVTYVSPDVVKGTENTDQTMKDGIDTLLLSPKLADQPVESAANEGTSAEEIQQHAEESNSTDKDVEPVQRSKDSAVLTPEDDHDKDDTREVTQLPNDTSSDHHCTNDSSTENVALTEEKLQETDLPSEEILSNPPCISEGEEQNIPVKTADKKPVDEKPTEEGESDQNEMTSELQNNHHTDGKVVDKVEKHQEVLENLSSGEAIEFAADEETFVEAIQQNAEESDITDKDAVPEQCINDSPLVTSVIHDPEMDEAEVVTQLFKGTSSNHHGTDDSSRENIALAEEIIQETNLANEETESDTACISEAEVLDVQVKTTDNKHEEEKQIEEDISSDLTNEVCEKDEVGQNKMSSEQEVLENERSIEDDFNTSADEASHEYSTSGETITTLETSNGDELQSKSGSSVSKEEETTVEVGDRSVMKTKDIEVPSGNTLSHRDVECQSKTLEDEEHKIAKVFESEQSPSCTSVKEDVQIENPAESLHVDLGNTEAPNSSHENKTEVLPVEESIDAADSQKDDHESFQPTVSGPFKEGNVNAVQQEEAMTDGMDEKIIDEVDKHEEATENFSTTVSTEDAGGSSLSKSDHSENKREDDSVKECEEVPLPLPLAREVDVPTDLHEAQFEDEETEKAELCEDERSTESTLLKTESITENTEDEHVNFEHTKASDSVEKISEGGIVDATEEKEETLENVPAVVPNDKMEENSYIEVDDQKRENEEQLDKENEQLNSIANNDAGVVKDEEKIEDENPSGVEKNTESDEIEETAIEAANTNEKTQELQNVSNEDRDKDLPIEVDASEMKHDKNLEEEHERPSLTEPSKDDPNDDKPAILPKPETGKEKVELLADEKSTGCTAPEKESLQLEDHTISTSSADKELTFGNVATEIPHEHTEENLVPQVGFTEAEHDEYLGKANQESSMPEALESNDIDELKYRGENLIKPDLETGENTETTSVKEETEVEKPIDSLQVKPEDIKQQDSSPDINRSIEEQISVIDPREISIDNTERESSETAQTNEECVEMKDIADCDKEDSVQIKEVGSPNPLTEASEGNANDDESTRITEDCLIKETESPDSLQLPAQDIETPPLSQDRELSSLDEHSPISYPEGITVDNKEEIGDDATQLKDESLTDQDDVISVPGGDIENDSPTEADDLQKPSSEKELAEKIHGDEPTTTHETKFTNEDVVQADLSENEGKIECTFVVEEVHIGSLHVADEGIKDSSSVQDREASHFEEQEPTTDFHGATGDQKDAETLDLTDPKEETLEDKDCETTLHKDTNEDSHQEDGSILEEKEQPEKDSESTSITDAPEDDITERTLVREIAQVENPIDSSQLASEDTEVVAPCEDTERSSGEEPILVSEHISFSSNEVTEKITDATKEDIQEAQNVATEIPHEHTEENLVPQVGFTETEHDEHLKKANQESSMPEALESNDIDEHKYRGENLIKPDLETGENTETTSVKEETQVEKPIDSLQVKPEDIKQQVLSPDINRSIEEQISVIDPREISIDNTERESSETAQTNEECVEIKDIAKDIPDCDKEDNIQIKEVGSPNPLTEASEGNANDDESTRINEDCLIKETESPDSLQLPAQDIETPPLSQDRELSSLDEHSLISYPEGTTVDNKEEIADDATHSKDEIPMDQDVVISVPSGDIENNSPTEADDLQKPSSEKKLVEKIHDDEPTTTHETKFTNEDAVQTNLSENEEKIECAFVEEEVHIDSLHVADEGIKDSSSTQDREASHFEEQEPTTDFHGATGDQNDAETLALTDPKEETLEDKDCETTLHKDTNEDSHQEDGSILEEKEQPEKDSESTSITDAPEDDITERTLVREIAQVENPIDSSQVASEDKEVVGPCEDTERSSGKEQILVSEDISSNEVTEKITDATKEEIQEAQDLAKNASYEDNSPNEQNIEAELTNEDLSTELPQVAVEDTVEPCFSEVRETSSQEEQILSASPGVVIKDNKENETIDPTIIQKEIPEDVVLKEMESVDVKAAINKDDGCLKGDETTTADTIVASNQETSLSITAEKTPCAEDLNINKDITGDILETSNYKQQESSITEVFEEHTVISKEYKSDNTSTEPGVSGKNIDQIVEEANSCGDKTNSEKIEVLNHGLTAVSASETLVTDPNGCTETEFQVPYEEKEAEVINQEAENDEKKIKETLPNDASEDVSGSEEVNGEDEINSNNYKGLSSSLISVAPEEVSTSNVALEEDLTSTSSQEPRNETREEADTEEDQNQNPAPQVSELIQDSPVEKIERDTHLFPASADDSVVTEEMQELERVPLPALEENTLETTDCKESAVVEDATNQLEQDDVTNSFSDDKMPTEKEQETVANDVLPASSSETPGVDHFPTEREQTNKEEPCTGNTATGDDEEKNDKGNDDEKEPSEEKISGINSAAPDVMEKIDTDVSKLTNNINNMTDSTDSMVINEDRSLEGNLVNKSSVTDLETKNDGKAPEIKETAAPSSAIGQDAEPESASVQETSCAGSLAEEKSDSNEVATTPIENKSGHDYNNQGLEPITQDQSGDINSKTEEEKLDADAEILFNKAVKEDIQEEIAHEKEIVKDDILGEKQQSPRVEAEDEDIQEYHQDSCADKVITDSHQEEEVNRDQQVNSKETDEFTKHGDETETVAKVSAHVDDKAPEDLEDKEVASEAVERILHQEDQVTSVEEPTVDIDDEKANELDIACAQVDTRDKEEEEGVQIAVIPDREGGEQNKKDDICSTDVVQATDEEELILSEEKGEEEAKVAYLEAEKLDFASQTNELSECAVNDGTKDIPKDNENSATNKFSEEDYPNKSRECEVPSAGEDVAATEQSTVETVIAAEVQEAKAGIDLDNAVPEAAGLECRKVEGFDDKCVEMAETSALVENSVVSTSKIIPEGTPLEAEYHETKLHGLPEELIVKDSEVKTAERDDIVNLQSVRDISEECKESFEVSNKENPMEGDTEGKTETSEVQETEPILSAPVSEILKQETEEQQLVRGIEDVHEQEKIANNIIPKQLESSYDAETEKVPEPSIHHSSEEDTAQHENKEVIQQNAQCSDSNTSEKDLPVNVGGVSNHDASHQQDKHVVQLLEADGKKNLNLENLDGDSNKISSEISGGEHVTVKPQKHEKEEEECQNEEGTNQEMNEKPESEETSPMADHSPAGKEPTSHAEDLQAVKTDDAEHETSKTDEEKDDEEESSREQEKSDLSSEAPVMVDMGDADVKVTPKKSHNILSGVGSKVKHSIAKVKKAITGKSSHPKTPSPSKVVN